MRCGSAQGRGATDVSEPQLCCCTGRRQPGTAMMKDEQANNSDLPSSAVQRRLSQQFPASRSSLGVLCLGSQPTTAVEPSHSSARQTAKGQRSCRHKHASMQASENAACHSLSNVAAAADSPSNKRGVTKAPETHPECGNGPNGKSMAGNETTPRIALVWRPSASVFGRVLRGGKRDVFTLEVHGHNVAQRRASRGKTVKFE